MPHKRFGLRPTSHWEWQPERSPKKCSLVSLFGFTFRRNLQEDIFVLLGLTIFPLAMGLCVLRCRTLRKHLNMKFIDFASTNFAIRPAEGTVADIEGQLQTGVGCGLDFLGCIHGLELLVCACLNWNQDKVR